MFCQYCGSSIPDGSKFCTNCGARFETAAPASSQRQYQQPQYQQQYQQQQQQQYRQPPQYQYQQQYQQANQGAYGAAPRGSVSFPEAVKLFFVNYVNFTGRATRSEFWWVALFLFAVEIVTALLDRAVGAQVFTAIVSLGTLLPNLGLTVRRLHDVGKPWPWIFIALIPLAGIIILIVYFCRPSDGDNRWGPGPGY